MERNQGQKWLGCMLAAHGSMMQHMDLAYHMEQSMKTTHAKPDIAGHNNFNIYEAGNISMLVFSIGLFGRWSPYPVQETILCT